MSLKIQIPIVKALKPLPSVTEPTPLHSHQKNNFEKLEKTVNSNWGGNRPGSGRRKSKLTILSAKEKREILHKVLSETNSKNITNYEQIIRMLIDKAKKDIKVASYVIDQSIGKATQAVQLDPDPEHRVVTFLPRIDKLEDREIVDIIK